MLLLLYPGKDDRGISLDFLDDRPGNAGIGLVALDDGFVGRLRSAQPIGEHFHGDARHVVPGRRQATLDDLLEERGANFAEDAGEVEIGHFNFLQTA
ncbi:hypothetical protein D3C87_1829040 [compost metagenome]